MASIAPDLDIEVIARSPFQKRGVTRFGGGHVRSIYAPRRQGFEALVSTFLGILRARWRGARLVHIHSIGPAFLAPLARLLGMRVVVTHHSVNYDHQKWGAFGRGVLRVGERSAMRFAHRVIAVAPWLARRLRHQFPARSGIIEFIPNGSGDFPESDGGSILDEMGLTAGSYILAVGRLVPEKNFSLLIKALRIASSDRKLVIVGDADHENSYARELRAEASDQVLFAGRRNRAELRTLYENAALFVLPSLHEGMPIVALEAAKFDCPMLLSDIEPNRDLNLPLINYFKSDDCKALAQALGQHPKRFAVDDSMLSRFEWDQIASQTVEVYREVLGRP